MEADTPVGPYPGDAFGRAFVDQPSMWSDTERPVPDLAGPLRLRVDYLLVPPGWELAEHSEGPGPCFAVLRLAS